MSILKLIGFLSICGPTFLVGIFGNLLVLASFVKNTDLRSPFYIYLCNIALADLTYLLLSLFNILEFTLNKWIFGDTWCRIQFLLINSVHASSLFTLSVLSAERYFSICKFRTGRTWLSTKCLKIAGSVWLLAVMITIPKGYERTIKMYEDGARCQGIAWSFEASVTYYTIVAFVLYLVPFCTILFTHYNIFNFLKVNTKNLMHTVNNVSMTKTITSMNDCNRSRDNSMLKSDCSLAIEMTSCKGKNKESNLCSFSLDNHLKPISCLDDENKQLTLSPLPVGRKETMRDDTILDDSDPSIIEMRSEPKIIRHKIKPNTDQMNHSNSNSSSSSNFQTTDSNRMYFQRCKQNKKVFKTLVLITVGFFVAIFPYVITRFLFLTTIQFPVTVIQISHVLLFLHPTVNFIIYICTCTELRQTIKSLLPCRMRFSPQVHHVENF